MNGIQLAQLVNSLLLLAVFNFLAGAEASHQQTYLFVANSKMAFLIEICKLA